MKLEITECLEYSKKDERGCPFLSTASIGSDKDYCNLLDGKIGPNGPKNAPPDNCPLREINAIEICIL